MFHGNYRVFYSNNFTVVRARDGPINPPFIIVGSPCDTQQSSAAALVTDDYELGQNMAFAGT